METLLLAALGNAATVALLAPLVLLVDRLGRRPALSHRLWLLLLLKLVTPPFAIPDLSREQAAGTRPAMAAAGPLGGPGHPAAPAHGAVQAAGPALSPTVGEPSRVEPTAKPSSATVPVASRRDWPAAWPQRAAWLWAAGAAAWFGLAGVAWYRLARRLRSCPQAEEDVQALASRIGATLGLRSVPAVHLIDGVMSPALVALGRRPRLLVPTALWAQLDGPRRSGLIAHELAHYRRRDHWLRPLELVILGLYWWFPVAWWVRRSLRHAEELCCDAWVVWVFPQQRRAYASALLDTLDFLADGPATVPILASGLGGATAIRHRLAFIAQGRAARRLSWAAAAVVLGVAAAVLPLAPPVQANGHAWIIEAFGLGGKAATRSLLLVPEPDGPDRVIIPAPLPRAEYDFALAPDGSWIVAGQIERMRSNAQLSSAESTLRRLVILKFRSDGTPDPDFGRGGTLLTDIVPTSALALNRDASVAVQADGRIVVATSVDSPRDAAFADVHVARFLPDGTTDRSFGQDGRVTLNVGRSISAANQESNDAVVALAIQADGRIVVAATASRGRAPQRSLRGHPPAARWDARSGFRGRRPDASRPPRHPGPGKRLVLRRQRHALRPGDRTRGPDLPGRYYRGTAARPRRHRRRDLEARCPGRAGLARPHLRHRRRRVPRPDRAVRRADPQHQPPRRNRDLAGRADRRRRETRNLA